MTNTGEKILRESGNLVILTGILFNLLILSVVSGTLWLFYLMLSQFGQLEFFMRGFVAA